MPTAPALLRDVGRLHARAQRAVLARGPATPTQCTILTEVGRGDPPTLSELARRLRLDKGWVSRAIEQLVHDGLVDRAPSDDDRRAVRLALTRAGRARHESIEAALDDQMRRVLARVPRPERAGVGRALKALHAAYQAELDAHAAAAIP